MEIKDLGNHTVLVSGEGAIKELLEAIDKNYPELKKCHILVDLSPFETLTLAEILPLESLTVKHRDSGKSFVWITPVLTYDEVPETLPLAPTVQEAKDLVEMEEIERDLGL